MAGAVRVNSSNEAVLELFLNVVTGLPGLEEAITIRFVQIQVDAYMFTLE